MTEPHHELVATRSQAAETAAGADAATWKAEDQFVARVGPIPAGVVVDSTTGREAADTDVAVDGSILALAYAWEDAVYTYVWNGEIWVVQQKLVPPDDISPPPSQSYGFGESLSLSGGSLIVAATGWDLTSGAAYVYRRVGAHWARPQRLPPIIWTGSFGKSVSISGNTAVVGTVGEEGSAAGAVYVFVDNEEKWTLQQRLSNDRGTTPGGELHLPYFGANVSVDGDTLAVGRFAGWPGEQTVWLYVRRGSSWRLQQTLVSSTENGTHNISESFVALALQGDTVVTGLQEVSLWSPQTGHDWLPLRMRVFTRRGSQWFSQTTLAPERPPTPGGAFLNFRVALSPDTLVYAKDSSGNSFIYNRTAGGWTEQRVPPFDSASKDVEDVAVNQRTALLGPSVFTRHGSSWRHTQRLKFRSRTRVGTSWPPPPIYSVSATDAKVAIASMTPSGEAQAEIYARSGSVWKDEAQLKIPAGTASASVALSGNRLLLSPLPSTGSRGARAFTQVSAGSTPLDATSGWREEHEFKAANGTPIAGTVSLSLDTALIGVPERGLAYVFVRGDSGWTEQATLRIAELPAGARFGESVSVSGNLAVVGAPQAEQDSGAAYVFARSGSSWTHIQKLTPTSLMSPARFGYSVSVSDDVILVGAPAAGARASGIVLEFGRRGSSWNETGTIAGDPTAAHLFGSAVSVAGDTAAIASHGADPAAYIFVKANGAWVRQRKISSMGTPDERIGASVSAARGTLALAGTRAGYVFGPRTRQPSGGDCSSPSDCSTDVCADGVCCDRQCDGECESCTGMLTGGTDGTCLSVRAGTRCGPDPHICASPSAYSTTPTCDASGVCQPNSTECDPGLACAGNSTGGYCVLDCAEAGIYDHTLCQESHWCRRDPAGGARGTCVPDLRGGGPCESSQQCASGECSAFWCRGAKGDRCQSQADCATSLTCRDGFCCDSACSGTCEACNVAGREGTCTPKVGQPEPGHGSCQGAEADCDGPCSVCAGRCDGSSPDCSYPGPAQQCALATCSGSRLTPASQCDGAGRCAAQTPQACPNLLNCEDAATCKISCTTHDDCAAGARCSRTGECMLPGPRCADAFTVQLPNGDLQNCSGHRCISDGQCAEACSDNSQCAPAYLCQSGRCKERSSASPGSGTDDAGSSDADCSCRAAGLRSSSDRSRRALGFAALVLGVSAALRRRHGAGVAARRRRAGPP